MRSGNVSSTARTVAGGCVFGNALNNLTLTGNTQVTSGGVNLYLHDPDAENVADTGTITTTPNTTS